MIASQLGLKVQDDEKLMKLRGSQYIQVTKFKWSLQETKISRVTPQFPDLHMYHLLNECANTRRGVN